MIGLSAQDDDPKRRAKQFQDIGLPEQVFIDALHNGVGAQLQAVFPFHPRMAPGMFLYLETVASLGRLSQDFGWTREDHRGFATIVRADGKVQIAVASGDGGTGDLMMSVSTRSPKGVSTEEAVWANFRLPFGDADVADNEKIVALANARKSDSDEDKRQTYFLLHDQRDGVLYAELSRPQSINAQGYVEHWEPRIPVTPQSLNPAVPSSGEPPVNPDFDVKRRGPA